MLRISVNPSLADYFSQFVPTKLEDCSELMSKQWAKNTFNSLEDFDPDNDLFFPLVLYADKTLVPTSINGIHWNHGCSQHPFFEGSSMRVLLHHGTWVFFHPWIILTSLLLMTLALYQMKAKRSCNYIMISWQYFFRKLNVLLKTSL
jgi:hypothetical protein